jgi:hypothetical protein
MKLSVFTLASTLRIENDNPHFIKKLNICIADLLIRRGICKSTLCFCISRDSSDNPVSINHIAPYTHGYISSPVSQHGPMPRATA